MLNLLLFSDTHGQHQKFSVRSALDLIAPHQPEALGELPPIDLAVHTGDIGLEGALRQQMVMLNDFADWFERQPGQTKIAVSGNHDYLAEQDPTYVRDTLARHGIIYLHHEPYSLPSGQLVFGSPYTPTFLTWANMRSPEALERLWAQIPDDTDFLFTHGPGYGTLDQLEDGRHIGDVALTRRVLQLPALQLHACGHVHSARGTTQSQNGQCLFVNAALVDEDYRPVHRPYLISLD